MKKIPVRSPFGLIQEDLWPNEWAILVACMMLNMTSRKQMEPVFREFIGAWSTPEEFLLANRDDVCELVKSLGFKNRRTDLLFKMTNSYLYDNWTHVRELPGIGEYAARAWEMFCLCEIGNSEPEDGALKTYWRWLNRRENEKTKRDKDQDDSKETT